MDDGDRAELCCRHKKLDTMPAVPPPQQSLRGPVNELHRAADRGSSQHVKALLPTWSTSIDQGDPEGITPLMMAAVQDHVGVMKILLNKGANVSVANYLGMTALHLSAGRGKLSATLLLMKAGADLDALTNDGSTPFHFAAAGGASKVMTSLIAAGANVNSRKPDGSTPLYYAACSGDVDAIRVLLRAKANPSLIMTDPSGESIVPLDAAAELGRLEVVRELIQQVGIEGCGGKSGGLFALELAAQRQQLDVMRMLADAGVVDTGIVLVFAASRGHEDVMKFLLQQHEMGKTAGGANYVNASPRGVTVGRTPLISSICFACSPRIVRLLVDAGANTTSAVRLMDADGLAMSTVTPLGLTTRGLRDKTIRGDPATEEQLRRLEAIRRLLLRVEAVYAVSWQWTRDAPLINDVVVTKNTRRTKITPTPLALILPIMRQRARARSVVLAPLFRYSSKP